MMTPRELLLTIDAEGVNLTSWEVMFISDLMDRLNECDDMIFTDDQVRKLEEIYDERVV